MKDSIMPSIYVVFVFELIILCFCISNYLNVKRIKNDDVINKVYEYYTNVQELDYNYINDVVYNPKTNQYTIEYNNVINITIPNSLFNSFIEEYNNDNKNSISNNYCIIQEVIVFDNNSKDISYYLVKANIQRP